MQLDLAGRGGRDARQDLQELALAVRNVPGIRAVVLGSAPPGAGVALVAAVGTDTGLDAGQILAEPARAVGGGAGKNKEVSIAGGRDPSRLGEALEMARRAAGSDGRSVAG